MTTAALELAQQRRGEFVDAPKQELARHETSECNVLRSSSWMTTGRGDKIRKRLNDAGIAVRFC